MLCGGDARRYLAAFTATLSRVRLEGAGGLVRIGAHVVSLRQPPGNSAAAVRHGVRGNTGGWP